MLFSYSFRRHQLHCSPSSLTISFLQYLFVLLLVKFLNYIKIIYVVNVRASLCFIWLILVLNPWCIFSGAVEFRWLFEAQSILGPIICWYYVQFSLEYSDAVARLFFLVIQSSVLYKIKMISAPHTFSFVILVLVQNDFFIQFLSSFFKQLLYCCFWW